MKFWFDITNTPQVHLLIAILNALDSDDNEFKITTRDFAETIKLLEQKTNLPYEIIGNYEKGNILKKGSKLINRFLETRKTVKDFDVSISCGSESAVWNSFLKNKKSIAFGDNDLAKQWTYGMFVSHVLFPKSIPTKILTKQGISKKKIYQYNGFKEHIYLADFVPNKNFKHDLPFDNYVVVRPENVNANYVRQNKDISITAGLLKKLTENGSNVLYLPRYPADFEFAEGLKNIYIPKSAINGIDACYFSDAVFTGAGTLAREAACLGVPSFSFFAGGKLLAVDSDLISQGKMYFSRDASKLYQHYLKSEKKEAELSVAKGVKKEVMSKLNEFIYE